LLSLIGGAHSLVVRNSGCSFTLSTGGSFTGQVGQYDGGQTKAGLSGTSVVQSGFVQNGDTISDSQGRGCWWTPPSTVLQCDVGQVPEGGFSIGCNGEVTYNGQSTFWQCATGESGVVMIYLSPGGSNCAEITLTASGCYPSCTTTTTEVTTPYPTTSISTGSTETTPEVPGTTPTTSVPEQTTPYPTTTISTGYPTTSISTGNATSKHPKRAMQYVESSSEACPGELTGQWKAPSLMVPIDSANPSTAYGPSAYGDVSATISTVFKFDVPSNANGMTCKVVFLLPSRKTDDLENSFNITGSGALEFSRLDGSINAGTKQDTVSDIAHSSHRLTVAPSNAYTVDSFACSGGDEVTIEMSGVPGSQTDVRFLQDSGSDTNACPLGLYMLV
ncbi:hypothetical protein M426DRAFT_37782, partial [Hypoxylon sp. CI-4A]